MRPTAHWLVCALIMVGCGDVSSVSEKAPASALEPSLEPPSPISEPNTKAEPNGTVYTPGSFVAKWRFTLSSPGGDLPFLVALGPDKGAIVDQHERLPFSLVEAKGNSLRLELSHYDSLLLLTRHENNAGTPSYSGTWTRRSPGKDAQTQMAIRAVPDADERFDSAPAELEPLVGRWQLTFEEEDGSRFAGLAVLRTREGSGGEPWVEGTILTDTGDYRYLEGALEKNKLRLAVFDGAHAFLFHATLSEGDLTQGHFWSRDSYHATFEGKKVTQGKATTLADPFDIVSVTSDDRRFHFDFPLLGGGRLNQDDPRFAGKVVVAEVFGTWCPNCNDQAPLMSKWYGEYSERGLEMVGIAFEFTGDEREDMDMLGRYASKYAVEYPLVLGGTSDKKKAGKQLADLSAVKSFPTTVFIGKDGRVRRVYSGFSGPATIKAYEGLQAEFRNEIEKLLAEE